MESSDWFFAFVAYVCSCGFRFVPYKTENAKEAELL